MSTTTDRPLRRGQHLTASERVEFNRAVMARYQGGESIRAIAAALGRSYGNVHRALVVNGARLRPRGGNTRGRS